MSQFKSDYEKCINAIKNFASEDNLCTVIRLHGYRASTEVMQKLSSAYGIEGVFAADDSRLSYDLTQEENDELNKDLIIRKNDLNYHKTNMRYESLSGVDAVIPILNELNYHNYLVLFTHDYVFIQYDARIVESLKWIIPNGYAYDDFSGIQNPEFLPLNNQDETALPFTLGDGWAIRSGTELIVMKKG